ncbi:MAG: hypothetical protein OEW39_08045 [Deltaproteobacteria bacterium]|nr:hypothetical protein [Deltaproteobacteria bacterium]
MVPLLHVTAKSNPQARIGRPAFVFILTTALFLAGCVSDEDLGTPPTGLPQAESYTIIGQQAIAAGSDTTCPSGGVIIYTGFDINGDGILQTEERDPSVTYKVCYGGNALVKKAADATGTCVYGGIELKSGVDINNDKVLDTDEEVGSAQYVCNGSPGAPSLIEKKTAPSANCTNGGTQIDIGLDDGLPTGTALDGTLQSGEIDKTYYACNGTNGSNGSTGQTGSAGFNTLVDYASAPVANCANGGTTVNFGLDDGLDSGGASTGAGTARDGILQGGEIDKTFYVCNGGGSGGGGVVTNGPGTWQATLNGGITEFASCGTAGGTEIITFNDLNGNRSLETGETVYKHDFICNGAAGNAGADGSNGSNGFGAIAITTRLPVGSTSCPGGGMKVEVYWDNGSGADGVANDGIKNGTEPLLNSSFVCDGGAGISQGDTTTPIGVSASGQVFDALERTVAANGTSYYQFTAHSDGAINYDSRYSIYIYDQDSNLEFTLFSDKFSTPMVNPPACALLNWGQTKACPTAKITAGSTRYFSLKEKFAVSNQYWLEAVYGADEGSRDTPVSLGTILASPASPYVRESFIGHASMFAGEAGYSYYSFTTSGGMYSLVADNILTVPGDGNTQMKMDLNDASQNLNIQCVGQDSFSSPNARFGCLANLQTAVTYQARLENSAQAGAKFNLKLEAGDTVTHAVPDGLYSATRSVAPGVTVLFKFTFTGTINEWKRLYVNGIDATTAGGVEMFKGHPNLGGTLALGEGSCMMISSGTTCRLDPIMTSATPVDYYIRVPNHSWLTRNISVNQEGTTTLSTTTSGSYPYTLPTLGRLSFKFIPATNTDYTLHFKPSTASAVSSLVGMYDPSFNHLKSWSCSASASAECTLPMYKPFLGTPGSVYYYIRPFNNLSTQADFTFDIWVTSGATANLTRGVLVNGSFTAPLAADYYAFNVSSGAPYTVTLTGPTLAIPKYMGLTLFNSSNTQIYSATPAFDTMTPSFSYTFTPTFTGLVYVKVDDVNGVASNTIPLNYTLLAQ